MIAPQYDINEHRHRFALWAAARAAQRGLEGGNNARLSRAIESCGVRKILSPRDSDDFDQADFDSLHRTWCRAILTTLEPDMKDATFGRAAKLLNVFLKCRVVLGPDGETKLSRVIHPPIDNILLKALSRADAVCSEHKSKWATLKWTKLDEAAYGELISQLRATLEPGEPFWKIEAYWDLNGL